MYSIVHMGVRTSERRSFRLSVAESRTREISVVSEALDPLSVAWLTMEDGTVRRV